jgi:hypothetical protein
MDVELNGRSTSYNGREGEEGWRPFLIKSELSKINGESEKWRAGSLGLKGCYGKAGERGG